MGGTGELLVMMNNSTLIDLFGPLAEKKIRAAIRLYVIIVQITSEEQKYC